jgi:diguanylate cyclase (GGDEF)-like protein
MQESLGHEIQRAQRSGSSVGVIAMDLDRFKDANDSLGHAAGDQLLAGLAALLQSGFRAGDISCRQGGDEFLVILPDITEAGALQKAEALRQALDQMIHRRFPALGGKVTLSAGVAMYPSDAATLESLQKAADLALYRAKENGRNRVFAASQLAVPLRY